MKAFIIFIFLALICVYASIMQVKFSNASESKLNYSTTKVRQMWEMCSFQFRRVQPNMERLKRIELCDCYVDHMRNTHTPEEVSKLTSQESHQLGLEMAVVCPINPSNNAQDI